jgi:hypothetical protein
MAGRLGPHLVVMGAAIAVLSLVAVPSLLLAWLDRPAVVALSLETDA